MLSASSGSSDIRYKVVAIQPVDAKAKKVHKITIRTEKVIALRFFI